MTRKHFETLAQSVREMRIGGLSGEQLNNVVDELVRACRQHSNAFDADRFRAACLK
jgi:hypothetical protein